MGIDAGASNPGVSGNASDPRALRDAALDAVMGGDAKRSVTRFDVTFYTETVKLTLRETDA